MKIAMINGQNHKGSTYHIGKMLADKLGGKDPQELWPCETRAENKSLLRGYA